MNKPELDPAKWPAEESKRRKARFIAVRHLENWFDVEFHIRGGIIEYLRGDRWLFFDPYIDSHWIGPLLDKLDELTYSCQLNSYSCLHGVRKYYITGTLVRDERLENIYLGGSPVFRQRNTALILAIQTAMEAK